MSFGRPPDNVSFAPSPPERGSFPLDHDGECKHLMQEYLQCLKKNFGNNGNCRNLSKAYLKCRMEKSIYLMVTVIKYRGLMAQDEMRNLGFQDDDNENDSSRNIMKNSDEEH
ncbi:4415_t:CDS:2 [Acaulospora colombiana]|uniref:4415_t:CDS:1 n=1 Tax=Acaulospora colombiana TaxID=27376 RepID=A0ACA9K4Y1_9GLOM|nr:4415_t:CDS:2 [Acaulospora colombiana]